MVHTLLDPSRFGKPVEWNELVPIRNLFKLKTMPWQFGVSALDLLVNHYEAWHGPLEIGSLARLRRAFNDMVEYHKGQFRKDKKNKIFYEVHPYHAALYAARSGCQLSEIVAALLHDVVEDCNVTLTELKHKYGSNVANIVRFMSNPKVFHLTERKEKLVGENDSHKGTLKKIQKVIEIDGEKKTLEALVVFPGNPLYYSQQSEDEKELEKLFAPELTQIKKNRLYVMKGSQTLSGQRFSAALLKQYDGKHNADTLDAIEDLEKRSSQLQKIEEVSGWAASRLNPALALYPEAPQQHQEVEPQRWYKMLASRNRLNFQNLTDVPHIEDNQINIHLVEGAPHEYEVLFPYAHFGSSAEDRQLLQNELDRQMKRLGEVTGALTLSGKSMLPPGLQRFHVFRVSFDPQRSIDRGRFLQALKNVHGLFSKNSKVKYFADIHRGEVCAVRRVVPYLKDEKRPPDADHYTVYLPEKFKKVPRKQLWKQFHRAGFLRPSEDDVVSDKIQGAVNAPHGVFEVRLSRKTPQKNHSEAFRKLDRYLKAAA